MESKYKIEFSGFLGHYTRYFDTKESAELYCRQIGRPELIDRIETIAQRPL